MPQGQFILSQLSSLAMRIGKLSLDSVPADNEQNWLSSNWQGWELDEQAHHVLQEPGRESTAKEA